MLRRTRPSALRSGIALALAATFAVVSPAKPAFAEITYEQILAAPDDVQLNLDYARQEVASGRLQQAAAALERLLLNRPNWDAVRLFYGIVLYRLNDLEGTKRELRLLEGRDLSPEQEADRARYLARAEQKSKAFRIMGRISIGGRYDTNPGRVSNSLTATIGPGFDDDHFAFTAGSRFRIEADLNNGRGDYLFFQSRSNLSEFFEVDRADHLVGRAQAGVKLHGARGTFAPYVSYAASFVEHESFRQDHGVGFDAALSLSSQVSLILKGEASRESYENNSLFTAGSQRNGDRIEGSVGLKIRPTDSLTLLVQGHWADKDARNDGFSYDAKRASAAAYKLFGMGRYLTASVSYTRTEYEQPDGFYTINTTREDDLLRFRVATGAPLGTLFSSLDLPDGISSIVAQAGVSYYTQDSNISQLDIDNWSYDLMLSKSYAY